MSVGRGVVWCCRVLQLLLLPQTRCAPCPCGALASACICPALTLACPRRPRPASCAAPSPHGTPPPSTPSPLALLFTPLPGQAHEPACSPPPPRFSLIDFMAGPAGARQQRGGGRAKAGLLKAAAAAGEGGGAGGPGPAPAPVWGGAGLGGSRAGSSDGRAGAGWGEAAPQHVPQHAPHSLRSIQVRVARAGACQLCSHSSTVPHRLAAFATLWQRPQAEQEQQSAGAGVFGTSPQGSKW